MSSAKNRRDDSDHIVSGNKDKRAERRNSNTLLRHVHDVNADEWDEFDFGPKEIRFKRGQKLE